MAREQHHELLLSWGFVQTGLTDRVLGERAKVYRRDVDGRCVLLFSSGERFATWTPTEPTKTLWCEHLEVLSSKPLVRPYEEDVPALVAKLESAKNRLAALNATGRLECGQGVALDELEEHSRLCSTVERLERTLGLGADPSELELLREEWAKAGEALFRGPAVPSRNEVIDGAKRVVLAAMKRAGLSITAAANRCHTSRRAMRDSMRRAGVYEGPVARGRQDIDWDAEPDLGKVSDLVLGKRHRCSPSTVASARHERGIAAYKPARAPARAGADDELGEVTRA